MVALPYIRLPSISTGTRACVTLIHGGTEPQALLYCSLIIQLYNLCWLMNIYFIASNCCMASQQFIRRSYKIIRLKGQHKEGWVYNIPRESHANSHMYTERRSGVLTIKEMQGGWETSYHRSHPIGKGLKNKRGSPNSVRSWEKLPLPLSTTGSEKSMCEYPTKRKVCISFDGA